MEVLFEMSRLRILSSVLLLLMGVFVLIHSGLILSFSLNVKSWNSQTWATVATVFLTFPIALYSFLQILERFRRRSSPFAIYRACRFDPSVIVNAYAVHGFSDYWPIEADADIDEAIRNHNHILLLGRPHIGKSRAAAHHIKKHFGKWWSLKDCCSASNHFLSRARTTPRR